MLLRKRLVHAPPGSATPHAFARFTASADEFLTRFSANHIHAVPGNYTGELLATCEFLGIDPDVIGDIPAARVTTSAR